MKKTIEIDGSSGEGGGQILRTALSLSCITGHALKLINIRKGRKRPRLPLSIAERQKKSVQQNLAPLTAELKAAANPSFGTGTFVFIKSDYENIIAGFTSLGERGRPAEEVGKDAALQFMKFHTSRGCLDPHLADQIVLYLSLAREPSSFTTTCITQHLMTNLWVIGKFLDVRYETEGDMNGQGKVRIMPHAY